MDFDLSADQAALRDAARDLLDGRCPPARVRQVAESSERCDRALWAEMVEQGWLGVAVPESAGGLGLGLVELAVLIEQAGAHVAPVPYRSTAVTIEVLRRVPGFDDEVAPLVAGARTACVAWSAAAGAASGLLVDGTGAEVRVTGRSDPVPWAPVADVALVVAADAAGAPAVVLLALDGMRPPAVGAMDLTRPLGVLELDGVTGRRVGGADVADRLLDLGAAATSVELLGASQSVLDMAVEYAKVREQFGRPIGSFQAIKHRCADMLVDVEGIRSSAYWAMWCLAEDDGDASVAASTAKTWSSDASKRVMASGLQVHGGIGFTWEHDLHLFLKRAQLDQVAFGDASFHRARLARMLRARVEAGASVL